ncbi:sigma-70 family RNA polymerase sigma factor [Salinarimonas ramus]|uniref:RNA polymerase sigma factor n=1 Tax=Salinarimonas ramus TaxID=690164 RepID=A0A917V1Y5_9HYPH|nr:sigma-70 family RNA polymerase sigma factor [Salinarimonas ramus]GGK18476.1 RNA polymerase sigma factor [Salinarimonas ramus]
MTNPVETHWSSLMRAANRGEEGAYRRLLAELAPAIRASIRAKGARYGLSGADVEDAVQETLLAIHVKRHTWREGEPIRPWVFAIAGYKIVDQMRRRYRHAEVDISDFTEILPAEPDEDPTTASDMDRVVARLSGRAGEVVRAIGLEGASVAEASQRFGMTEGAVRVALHRGLRKLADLRAGMVG